MNPDDRMRLTADYLPLVGYAVTDICRRTGQLPPEDLASAGAAALSAAAGSYDPAGGRPFAAFARRRIFAALLDLIDSRGRTAEPGSETPDLAASLAAALGRRPTAAETASALGSSLDPAAGAGVGMSMLPQDAEESAPVLGGAPADAQALIAASAARHAARQAYAAAGSLARASA